MGLQAKGQSKFSKKTLKHLFQAHLRGGNRLLFHVSIIKYELFSNLYYSVVFGYYGFVELF